MTPRMIQAVLTTESQKQLLDKYMPKYKKLYAHHVTVAYQPNEADMKNVTVANGQQVMIMVGNRYWANGVDAVEVKVYTMEGHEVHIKNTKPHITVSTNGKPPVLSNDMLQGKGEFRGGFEGIDGGNMKLDGVIEFVS